LSWKDVKDIAKQCARAILDIWPEGARLFGIPRGGVYAAMAIAQHSPLLSITEDSGLADIIVDDIYDSGRTMKMWKKTTGNPRGMCLIDKRNSSWKNRWVEFPWERMNAERGPEENVVRMLQYIGEDVQREGLLETPERVVRSWYKLYGGYRQDPKDILKTFEDDSSDEMVVLKDIEFYSTCEHHILPFFGKAHIAYIPDGKVVGISKLARLLECFARRLQIQERICRQVTSILMKELRPLGAACLLEAQHFCMTSRGVEKQNSIMVTSSLEGVFKSEKGVKEEFLTIVRG